MILCEKFWIFSPNFWVIKWYLINKLLHSISVFVNGYYLWLLLNLLNLSWSRLDILIYFCLKISFFFTKIDFPDFFLIFIMNFSKNVYLDFSCILWDSCKWNESPVIWLRGWVLVQWFTRWWSRSVYLNTKSIGFTRSECALGCEKHIFHA